MEHITDKDYPPVSVVEEAQFLGQNLRSVFHKFDGLIGASYDSAMEMISLHMRLDAFNELKKATNAEVTTTEHPKIRCFSHSITIDGVEYHALQDAKVSLVRV